MALNYFRASADRCDQQETAVGQTTETTDIWYSGTQALYPDAKFSVKCCSQSCCCSQTPGSSTSNRNIEVLHRHCRLLGPLQHNHFVEFSGFRSFSALQEQYEARSKSMRNDLTLGIWPEQTLIPYPVTNPEAVHGIYNACSVDFLDVANYFLGLADLSLAVQLPALSMQQTQDIQEP